MRLWIGVAAAAFLAASPAAAQTPATFASQCGDYPAAPELIDTASARPAAIDRTTEAVNAWVQSVNAVNTCRNQENANMRALSDRFRADETAATALLTDWTARVNAYNERAQSGNTNERRRGRNLGGEN